MKLRATDFFRMGRKEYNEIHKKGYRTVDLI